MSDEKIQLIFGIGILSIIIFFIVIAIIQTKKNNEFDKITMPNFDHESYIIEKVVESQVPKHTMVYEYDHILREYYIVTDFQLQKDRYDESIPDIYSVKGIVSTTYINKYTGKFSIGSLFKSEEVLNNVVKFLEKYRRIEIEVIDNSPENK